MSDKELLALMYDFYNEHTLVGQNDDIGYYINQIKEYNAKNVLVVGAGTGRVAIPLSNYTKVTALDFDEERLNLLRTKSIQVDIVCLDFLEYKTDNKYDLIIFPYSTFQFDNDLVKISKMLSKIKEIASKDTTIIIDFSESFNSKKSVKRQLIFRNYCSQIKSDVEVYYTAKKYDKYIEFIIEYKIININHSVFEHEKYYYYDKNLLEFLFAKNNINIIKIDDGYGKDGFKHKHLYHCRSSYENK